VVVVDRASVLVEAGGACVVAGTGSQLYPIWAKLVPVDELLGFAIGHV